MATTTYKTTRTTNVEVTRRAAPSTAPRKAQALPRPHSPAFSVALTAPGELRISGVNPEILSDRLAAVVRLLTR